MTPRGELRVEGLTKAFDAAGVLEGVDLAVPAGGFAAVLGASGSGKTTLLRCVAGFERPDRGVVRIDGEVVDDDDHHVRAEQRHVGYVAQEGSLFPHLDARANVAFGLRRGERRGRRPEELLAAVGLDGLGARFPHELSGGQQQRVALARALATRPRLVLLDEPFASLDANLRADVRAEVASMLRDAGTTVLLVTHDQDEALSTADLVAVLRDGVVAQCDAPRALYDHPVDAQIARFVGEANLVAGVAEGDHVRTAFGLLGWRRPAPCTPGAAVTVLVRPEQLELCEEPGAPGARVLASEYHGHDTTVRLAPDPDARLPGVLVARVPGGFDTATRRVRLAVRAPVEAWVDEDALERRRSEA